MQLSSYFFKFRIKKRSIGSDALPQRIQNKKEAVRTEAAACEVSRAKVINFDNGIHQNLIFAISYLENMIKHTFTLLNTPAPQY